MRNGLLCTGLNVTSLPVEVHDECVKLYSLNFPSMNDEIKKLKKAFGNMDHLKLPRSNITALPMAFFDNPFDIWTMSPPCQPYTRQRGKINNEDKRNGAFGTVLRALRFVKTINLPKLIILENVVGFEIGEAFTQFKDVLNKRMYKVRCYTMSPLQCGFPNERKRVYVIAYLKTDNGDDMSHFDSAITTLGFDRDKFSSSDEMLTELTGLNCGVHQSLRRFIFDNLDVVNDLIIPQEVFDDPKLKCIDLVCKAPVDEDIFTTKGHLSPASRTYTSCFTKSYGRYWMGTGSLLCIADELKSRHSNVEYQSDDILDAYKESRYFHPLEVAALMGFQPAMNLNDNQCRYTLPPDAPEHQCNIQKMLNEESWPCCCVPFNLPTEINRQTVYKMLGNSLNPQVVSLIIRDAFQP